MKKKKEEEEEKEGVRKRRLLSKTDLCRTTSPQLVQRGNNNKKGFYLKGKARIWP